MGAPKQRWSSEEEAALRAAIVKHGSGNWRTILKDPEFSFILRCRSNVDLKVRTFTPQSTSIEDKWRNIKVFFTASGSRDKGRAAIKKNRAAPKNSYHSMAISAVASDVNDDILDAQPIASVSSEVWNASNLKIPHSRLDNIILECVNNLNEPTGSHRTTIAKYIEEQYWLPSDFDYLLCKTEGPDHQWKIDKDGPSLMLLRATRVQQNSDGVYLTLFSMYKLTAVGSKAIAPQVASTYVPGTLRGTTHQQKCPYPTNSVHPLQHHSLNFMTDATLCLNNHTIADTVAPTKTILVYSTSIDTMFDHGSVVEPISQMIMRYS